MNEENKKRFFWHDQGKLHEGICTKIPHTTSFGTHDYWVVPFMGSWHQDNLFETRADARQAACLWVSKQIVHYQDVLAQLAKE